MPAHQTFPGTDGASGQDDWSTSGTGLASRQLRDPSLADLVAPTLLEEALPLDRLRLEITDRVLVEELRTTKEVLRRVTSAYLGSTPARLGLLRLVLNLGIRLLGGIRPIPEFPGRHQRPQHVVDHAHAEE
jgi:hypothetical protein